MKLLEQQFAPYSPPNTNLVEQIRYWSLAQPEKIAFRFLTRVEESECETLTYAELDQRARAIAAQLVAKGFAGQRALMLYPPGLDFVEAFFGCHYAGVVPVPAYPPRRNRNMGRINSISNDAHAAVALTIRSVIARSEAIGSSPSLQHVRWLPTDEVPDELASDWVKPKLDLNSLGLIQYTSGSTGTPKGVMLTHRNIVANCAMITHAFGLTQETLGISWLPTYHDMGLIGGVLSPAFCGIEMTLMSPVTFLTRPMRWLQAISDYRITVSGGPNFAYRWCTMKIKPEECEGLDLSAWEVAFNGAEPIRADVLEEFTKKFEPYGFRHSSHYPCYGMAETSLIVTGGKQEEPPIVRTFCKQALGHYRVKPVDASEKNSQQLVGSGQVLPTEEVIIVHPENRKPLGEGLIGEIWINSPSSGLGYWNRAKETEEVFHGRLATDNGKNYVRSGDLGFIDNGELFVTGRLKDMIIVRGVNRYPQDIEATVENCDERLRSGGAAAFAVDHWDREHLIVVCEVERRRGSDWEPLLEKIRKSVISDHDLPPDAIVLVRHNSVPKTSSGKVQRLACRQQFMNNRLEAVARWSTWDESPVDETPVVVTESASHAAAQPIDGHAASNGRPYETLDPNVVESVLRHVKNVAKDRAKNLSVDTNIVIDLGLDSLERLEIARELELAFGGRFPDEVLQEIETVGEVALAIQKHIGRTPAGQQLQTVANEDLDLASIPDSIPDSYYQLEKMPEYMRLQNTKDMVEASGSA